MFPLPVPAPQPLSADGARPNGGSALQLSFVHYGLRPAPSVSRATIARCATAHYSLLHRRKVEGDKIEAASHLRMLLVEKGNEFPAPENAAFASNNGTTAHRPHKLQNGQFVRTTFNAQKLFKVEATIALRLLRRNNNGLQ